MAKSMREPAFDQWSQRQLSILFEISKAIAGFETVELTFPGIMALAAEVLPLQTAILIESRGGPLLTVLWANSGVEQGKGDMARKLANLFYGQLVGAAPPQTIPSFEEADCIALPLVVYRRPTFGALLLQGVANVNASDLMFMDALTNLIAVAVDRYYTANEIAKLHERNIADLESERELRENFVSILTHDLRNPLTAVKMQAELIFRKSEAADCRKVARQIVGIVDRLNHMIENLLDASLISAGERLLLHIEEFDLREMLKELLDELAESFGDRIVFIADQKVHGYWSREGIRRAIENLLSNAAKYGDPGRPIKISLKQTSEIVQIAVYNEGKPIPQEDIPRLFQQYRRAKAARAGGIPGWGLGLTLVRGVAEAHGGTVKVESGNGTTFTMEFPNDARAFDRTQQPEISLNRSSA